MPRNMSFFRTQAQVRNRTKTVTRRKGWKHLKPGDRFWAIVKGQGLKKGERVERICLCECVSNRREPLVRMPEEDVRLEGFPEMTRVEFLEMFCRNMDCGRGEVVSRIEFKYVEHGDA